MKELVQIRGRCQETLNTLQKGVTQLHHGIARRNQATHVLMTLTACSRIALESWKQQELLSPAGGTLGTPWGAYFRNRYLIQFHRDDTM